MSFDRLVVLRRQEEVVVGGFRGEVVGVGEHHRAKGARVLRTGECASGGERVGVRGGRYVSEVGRFGVA